MHGKHADEDLDSLEGCYNCHPGPETQCLRDVMATEHGMDCVACHGGMADVANENRVPWVDEPTCAGIGCHDAANYGHQDLYRKSREHGGVYCAGCHDSPHAIAPSREAADAIKFVAWQGYEGTLNNCLVCHTSLPVDAGPHGQLAGEPSFTFGPDRFGIGEPGTQMVYTHTLENTGDLGDTYLLDSASSQEWAVVTSEPSPLDLLPDATGVVTVTITIPEAGVAGLTERTIVTATSTLNSALSATVVDTTSVPRLRIYLPLILRGF